MSTLKELREVRLEKLNKLKELGIDPYPARTNPTNKATEFHEKFSTLEDKTVTASGRIVSLRKHGKLMFIDLKDATGKIQLYIKEENIKKANYANSELNYEELDLLDTGDFAEGTGKLTKTKSGEISIEVQKIRLLTKSLRPLPDSWDGFKDKETRLRRRYLDTNVNEEVYKRFERRAKFWQVTREFLNKKGFLEMNIPVLESIIGGADAKPFVTHMDAIDQDFYLRISQELYLKRLIGGGYEKVYEIGPRFRNEGLSDEHLPEHIALEFYWAYADWEEGMDFIEELFNHVIKEVYGDKKVFSIRGFEVDFSKGWERIDFAKLMSDAYDGLDINNTTIEEVEALIKKHNIKGDFDKNIARGVDNLWKNLRKTIGGPAFLINHPKYLSPLSKSKFDNPMITERIQPIIAGSELGNGWSELNDPLDQLERFQKQQELRDSGDEEAQMLDIDYVEMLEYGMPPTFGWGHSERVFWFLEDVTAREGVPFPQLKHEIDSVTRDIYGFGEESSAEDSCDCGGECECNDDCDCDCDCEHEHECACGNGSCGCHDVTDEYLPTKEEAQALLERFVLDDYQKHHAKMVATAMEAYAKELGEDPNLWYVTGLLHDLDYFMHPEEHPGHSLEWFEHWGLPNELIHAVAAHAHERTGIEPASKMASALCAIDELAGFLYAYSLMRPNGFEGMEAKSVRKKFKDKAFAAKIDRNDISYGVEKFGVDFDDHINFLLRTYSAQ